MTHGWLDPNKYEHIPVTSATGPGTMHGGYAWKWVNHSTEGPPGSIAGTISLFRSSPGSCPHFMIDPMGTGRRVQFIPWEWSACALIGGRGGWQTNRGRAIQVEIVGYAAQAPNWPDSALWAIADLIADVIKDGCPINPHNVPDDSGLRGTLATSSSPQRMSWETWRGFDGITAHVRVPNNDHWDTGAIRSLDLQRHVLAILGGATAPAVGGPVRPFPPVRPAPVGYVMIGMAGREVRTVQELLVGLGFNVGGIDGLFGEATETAVDAFQKQHGLVVDGVVGPQTLAKLSELYGKGHGGLPKPLSDAPSWGGRFFVLTDPLLFGSDVRVWQNQMAQRGWPVAADGLYGPISYAVCEQFQAEKRLRVDGIVGPATWTAAWTEPIT